MVVPVISVTSSERVVEGQALYALFKISLSEPVITSVSVRFETQDLIPPVTTPGATAGVDYGATGGVAIFSPGQVEQIVRVPIYKDNIFEPNESFNFRIFSPQGGVLGRSSFLATISDFLVSDVDYQLPLAVSGLMLTGNAMAGYGNNFDNTIYGNNFDNILGGGGGNDILDGGLGADSMIGGVGNDTYYVDNSGDRTVEQLDAGIDTVVSTLEAYTLEANIENLTLSGLALSGNGNSLNNVLLGNDQNNILVANDGDDILDGGKGFDSMFGGNGNDTYYVDNYSDRPFELENQGHDRVISSAFSYGLGANLEDLTLVGSALVGLGNSLDNKIIGNSFTNNLVGGGGNDILNGGLGNDLMLGGTGNDIYYVDSITDRITEYVDEGRDIVYSSVNGFELAANVENLILIGTAVSGYGNSSNNVITGNSLNNFLTGGMGNDVLNGGLGADTLAGGMGNDTYYVDNFSDSVVESIADGVDTIVSSLEKLELVTNVENLILIGTAVSGYGNSLNNVITGNSLNNFLTGGMGNDVLNGALGADTLAGGMGNDTYYVDNLNDSIVEGLGNGIDTALVSLDRYALAVNVENLTLIGSAVVGVGNSLDNVITGNSLNNTLTGGMGNDILNGGLGADVLAGEDGNDIYYVDHTSDDVIEGFGLGKDTVYSSAGLYRLTNNVENLSLFGSAVSGLGNSLDNVITGNSLNNTLTGGMGNDILNGGLGDDILAGDEGNDTLIYTAGSDKLNGGLGDDLYLITSLGVPGTAPTTVEIQDNGGSDTVSFERLAQGLRVDLNSSTALNNSSTGFSLVLPVVQVENVIGTSGADILSGNILSNRLVGGAGNDILVGGAGNDTLVGGLGADSFAYVNAPASSGVSTFGLDTIVDFNRDDRLVLAANVFDRYRGSADFAVVSTDSLVESSAATMVFVSGSDRLYYNANGSAAGFGNSGGELLRFGADVLLTADQLVLTTTGIN